MKITEHARIQRQRRRLAEQGLRLWKVSERSRYRAQYGPYSIMNASTTGLVAQGLWLDDVEAYAA